MSFAPLREWLLFDYSAFFAMAISILGLVRSRSLSLAGRDLRLRQILFVASQVPQIVLDVYSEVMHFSWRYFS